MARAAERGAAWIAGLGVRVQNTRIGRLVTLASGLHDAWSDSAASVERFIDARTPEAIYAALGDIYELDQIYWGLAGEKASELVQRLRKYVRGPDRHEQEDPRKASTQAGRDHGFELSIAAQLTRAGLVTTLPANHADVVVQFPRGPVRRVFIECKRPKTEESLERNVRRALRQLEDRYRTARRPSRARGMIAVSMTKLSNPGSLIARAESPAGLEALMTRQVQRALAAIRPYWIDAEETRTVAALVEFRCISEVGGVIVPAVQYAIDSRAVTRTDVASIRHIARAWHQMASGESGTSPIGQGRRS
jgi:hypothetical protein